MPITGAHAKKYHLQVSIVYRFIYVSCAYPVCNYEVTG